jgi:beta-glucosidase
VKQLRSRVKTLVVVLVSGRPLILGDVLDSADAVVAAWLPGSEGAGVADGLFGVTPFTGKLPVSWPASVDQLPFDHTKPLTGTAAPLFPFGYGLAK